MIVDTAGGPIELPDGTPDWVVQNQIDQHGGPASPPPENAGTVPGGVAPPPAGSGSAADAGGNGTYVIARDGTVLYFDRDLPDWVRENLLQQHGGRADAPTSTSRPPNVPPVPSRNPGPVPGAPPVGPGGVGGGGGGGGLSGLLDRVGAVKDRIVDGVGGMVGGVASSVGDIAGGLINATREVVRLLAPTVAELALSLTHRVADTLGFIGNNLASVGDFAGALAAGLYEPFSELFGDAWTWFARGFLALFRAITSPLASALTALYSQAASPAL